MDGMGRNSMLVRVVAPHFVAGLIFDGTGEGRVVRTAPILHKLRGHDGRRGASVHSPARLEGRDCVRKGEQLMDGAARIIALYPVHYGTYGHILYALTDSGAVWQWAPAKSGSSDHLEYVWRRLTLPYEPVPSANRDI